MKFFDIPDTAILHKWHTRWYWFMMILFKMIRYGIQASQWSTIQRICEGIHRMLKKKKKKDIKMVRILGIKIKAFWQDQAEDSQFLMGFHWSLNWKILPLLPVPSFSWLNHWPQLMTGVVCALGSLKREAVISSLPGMWKSQGHFPKSTFLWY